MKNKLVLFLLTYLLASLISGVILFLTDFSFSIWSDPFEWLPFLTNLLIWVFSFYCASFLLGKVNKN